MMRVETFCVQVREDVPSETQPLIAPVYPSAVWALDSAEQCDALYAGAASGYIYSRDANPNHAALERAVAGLEGTEAAVVFASGMAALAAAVTGFSRAGGRVVAARQLYGATCRLLTGELARFGVETVWVDGTDPDAVAAALAGGADLVLVETVSNPLMELADLPRLAELCRGVGARFVVDNTFPSPCGCRPREWGADVVIHSVTKFLGGHSDLTLGAAACSGPDAELLRRQARLWGGAANPWESWLALRGITTLPLRMERSSANAADLARRLAGHPAVIRVHYPGLPSHPQHTLAGKLLATGGAMLAFEVAGGARAAAVVRGLRHIRFAPSLGDTATTISYPAGTSHRGLAPEELAAIRVTPGLLRLSVGIDHAEDVWEDLEQALTGSMTNLPEREGNRSAVKRERSKELLARAAAVIAGGVNSNVRLASLPQPLFFREGRGPRIWDEDGNEYLDYVLGQGPLIHGHSHPALLAAAQEGMARGMMFAGQHVGEIELAERV
ncbi:MAG: aminotransferase class III-fold pyridoxal phosphate-dependent enzyme, partial [Armatimonadetes bacterium]|nr:aminotransferase class III-fold pyridoxal phosphate-dependent enzyme [Armatimonadota bacterium]